MKLYFIPLLFLLFSYSINAQDGNANKCEIQLSKQVLASEFIELSCEDFMNRRSFMIKNFNIKFPEEPTIKVVNNQPDLKQYIRNLREGEQVAIFNIKGAYDGDELITDKKIPNFIISVKMGQ